MLPCGIIITLNSDREGPSMRRKLFVLFLIGILISSCNLPVSSIPTLPVDVLATHVSSKLTQTAAVGVKQATNTGLPRPTSTPAQTNPTQAASTPTPTNTGAAFQTPSQTPTPTGVPGDPKTALGNPAWKETFQKASAWGLDIPYDDGHTRVSITPGKIVLKSYDGNGWHGWRMINPKIQNFYLEATIQTQTCSGADLYGLVFRANDKVQGYWFGVTCDGRYNLTSGDIYNEAELIKPKASQLIGSGSNQTNRLGVMAKDNKITLYLNGKVLEEVTNDTYPSAGTFGYFIAGFKTPGFTYESTEIAYWNLP
jgi:hypothetical protein